MRGLAGTSIVKVNPLKLTIIIDGRSYEVEVEAADQVSGTELQAADPVQSSVVPTFSKPGSSQLNEAKVSRSPLAGVVARLHANAGQQVKTLNSWVLRCYEDGNQDHRSISRDD